MYVKLFNHILDSSIAENRPLRHFFTDLMLCSDPDGNVIMTKTAISKRIGATPEEVEWGLGELMKPDPSSKHPDMEGRRIVPLDGLGYGWQIVNFKFYRDMKSAEQMRADTAERVRRYREREKAKKKPKKKKTPEQVQAEYDGAERRYVEAEGRGAPQEELDQISDPSPV